MRNLITLLGGIVLGVALVHFWAGPIDWSGVRDEAGEAMGDAAVTASVRAALALQKEFDLFGGIAVRTRDGVVTLEGDVASERQRELATLITRGVDGVDEVVNELRIKEDAAPTGGAPEG